MSNPTRGTVSFQALDRTYVLEYGVNALCELEDAFGCDVSEIGKKLKGNFGLKSIRTMLWAGLQDHPENGAPDEAAAGHIMDDLGILEAGQKVGEAFKLAFPEAAKEVGGTTARPQNRQQRRAAEKSGTGTAS